MHGIILAELQRYVQTNVGPRAWADTCRLAKVGHSSYSMQDQYPEGDLSALVEAGARILGVPVPALLEDLGSFIIPTLMQVCQPHLPPEARTLDLLADPERRRLMAERLTGRAVTPAALHTERTSERELRIVYGSSRRMCGLTRGIVRGLLSHFREVGMVRESACMLLGSPQCIIEVTRLGN